MAKLYNFFTITETELKEISQSFHNGSIIIMPTETVYGLCCMYGNQNATQRIYSIKNRDPSKPLSILVDSIEMLDNMIKKIPEAAIQIISQGNTVILPLKEIGTIGARIPNNQKVKEIIRSVGKPIIATSVNISNQPPAYLFSQIDQSIIQQVDIAINGDICSGKSSDVISFVEEKPKQLR